MKSKTPAPKAVKPSKAFVKEMEKMYPKGAVITPKKAVMKVSSSKGKK